MRSPPGQSSQPNTVCNDCNDIPSPGQSSQPTHYLQNIKMTPPLPSGQLREEAGNAILDFASMHFGLIWTSHRCFEVLTFPVFAGECLRNMPSKFTLKRFQVKKNIFMDALWACLLNVFLFSSCFSWKWKGWYHSDNLRCHSDFIFCFWCSCLGVLW